MTRVFVNFASKKARKFKNCKGRSRTRESKSGSAGGSREETTAASVKTLVYGLNDRWAIKEKSTILDRASKAANDAGGDAKRFGRPQLPGNVRAYD